MAENTTKPSTPSSVASGAPVTDTADLVTESLVEEVSIDGMCGVY